MRSGCLQRKGCCACEGRINSLLAEFRCCYCFRESQSTRSPQETNSWSNLFFIIAHLIVRLKGLDAWSSNMHVVAFIVLDERGYLVGPLTHDQPMTHACRIQSHKLRRLCPPSLPMSCGLQRGARAGAKTGILEEMEETQDLEC